MQWLGIFIFTLFGFGIKELAIRALTGVGFGLVTTYGIYRLFDQLQDYFQAQLNGMPSDVLALLGLMRVDICFTMILSAAAAKQVFAGWNKLTDKRTGRVWHAPGTGGSQPF